MVMPGNKNGNMGSVTNDDNSSASPTVVFMIVGGKQLRD